MAKDEPKPKLEPEDSVQSALDAVERATGEQLADALPETPSSKEVDRSDN